MVALAWIGTVIFFVLAMACTSLTFATWFIPMGRSLCSGVSKFDQTLIDTPSGGPSPPLCARRVSAAVAECDLRWGILAMPYIVSGRLNLFFEESGCGYPIIFLHEFESDFRSLDRLSARSLPIVKIPLVLECIVSRLKTRL
jgi:hypothetical protein